MQLQTLAPNLLLLIGNVGIAALITAFLTGSWRTIPKLCAMFFFTLTALTGGILLILAYIPKEYHFVVFSLLAVMVGCAVGGYSLKRR